MACCHGAAGPILYNEFADVYVRPPVTSTKLTDDGLLLRYEKGAREARRRVKEKK